MPVRFRKSVPIGSIRFNFGKRGLTSVSTGVRGFRVTTSSSGTRVTTGVPGTGLSYIQRVGASKSLDTPSQQATIPSEAKIIQTAGVHELTEISSQGLLDRINKCAGQFPLVVVPAIAFLLALYPAYLVWDVLVIPVLIVGVAVAWWVYRVDTRYRTTHLDYEFDEQTTHNHATIQEAFQRLSLACVVWRVISRQSANWKQHGGASTLITRNQAVINKAKPPYISANVFISSIATSAVKLFFFPDQMLVWQQGRYGAVAYESLILTIGSTRFVEDRSVPRDATVVGQTWLHPNKSGGPDRRFASNRQVPNVRYGTLELTSPTGLNIHFQISSDVRARQFAETLQSTSCRVSLSPVWL
jgi:hypothetical protein